MRYSDSELFDITELRWQTLLDEEITPRIFFEWCLNRLEYLVKDSTNDKDWMKTENNHLRTYRMKAIEFYLEKKGK